MRGSIINRPKGSDRWSIILEVRDEATGKRKRRWQIGRASCRERV